MLRPWFSPLASLERVKCFQMCSFASNPGPGRHIVNDSPCFLRYKTSFITKYGKRKMLHRWSITVVSLGGTKAILGFNDHYLIYSFSRVQCIVRFASIFQHSQMYILDVGQILCSLLTSFSVKKYNQSMAEYFLQPIS